MTEKRALPAMRTPAEREAFVALEGLQARAFAALTAARDAGAALLVIDLRSGKIEQRDAAP